MINFPCITCGEPLSVPADMAGGEIQCPVCGNLNSIPLVSDLPNLGRDGTHLLAPVVDQEDPDRIDRLARAFGRSRVDDEGYEIDNRTLPDEIAIAPPPPPPREAPRYDPETGELITAIPIARAAPVPAIPVGPGERPGPPAVNYATPGRTEAANAGPVWLELFHPVNVFVMAVVMAAHVVGGVLHMFILGFLGAIAALGGPELPPWLFNLLFWLAVAHYGNVVQETGPEERDELPRPLRNVAFGEDVFHPLVKVLLAFILTYGPAAVMARYGVDARQQPAYVALLLAAGLLFLAVLLTVCGSNTLANLRPDRLLNVVRHSGLAYWRLALITTLTVPAYLWAAAGADLISPALQNTPLDDLANTAAGKLAVVGPLFVASVYAAHGVCWRLGQLVRRHGLRFGWAWESHELARQEARRRRQAEREAAARRRSARPSGGTPGPARDHRGARRSSPAHPTLSV